jgi:hypothetical protein
MNKLRMDVIAVVISIFGLLFSGGTMLIAGVQVKDAREFARLANDATVVVDVDAEPGRNKRGITLRNAGPGVAHIKGVKYFVDGQAVEDISEAFGRIAQLDANRLLEVTMNGDTMSPGEKQQILRFDAAKSEQERAEDFFEDRLNVFVTYCGAGGRCDTVCADPKRCTEATTAVSAK